VKESSLFVRDNTGERPQNRYKRRRGRIGVGYEEVFEDVHDDQEGEEELTEEEAAFLRMKGKPTRSSESQE
jgi:hypothetical protein